MSLIRTISGVRGIVGSDLDSAAVYRHARAFAALQPPGPLLVARDSRPHGRELQAVVSRAFKDGRRQVQVAGLVPTPTAQFLVPLKRLAGAVVLTASHNPIEYNGMKFIGGDGCFLDQSKLDILFARADQTETPEKLTSRFGDGKDLIEAAGLHILDVLDLSCIDTEAILRRRFQVVVDAVNGAAYFALPALLEALGCQVVRLNCTPDGTFPRGAEPLPDHLTGLCAAVVEHSAHLGMATDPDADRLALVDENGVPLGEELTQVLAVDGFLRRTGGRKPVVTNLSSSLLLDHVTRKYGIEVQRSAVGEINVVNLMRSIGGEIGGEGNGGVILAESHLGRDSLVGAALILDRMAQQTLPLSAIKASLPTMEIVKDKVPLGDEDPEETLAGIAQKFSDAEQNTLDGLKLIWDDRWIHIRRSNTEPVIRIIAEAPSAEIARDLVEQVRSVVSKPSSGEA